MNWTLEYTRQPIISVYGQKKPVQRPRVFFSYSGTSRHIECSVRNENPAISSVSLLRVGDPSISGLTATDVGKAPIVRKKNRSRSVFDFDCFTPLKFIKLRTTRSCDLHMRLFWNRLHNRLRYSYTPVDIVTNGVMRSFRPPLNVINRRKIWGRSQFNTYIQPDRFALYI